MARRDLRRARSRDLRRPRLTPPPTPSRPPIADLRALLEHSEGPPRRRGRPLDGREHRPQLRARPPGHGRRPSIVADTGAGSDEAADWAATVHAFADALERDGLEAFADAALANPLFARYAAQGPAAERFIRACLMTHRARGLAHTGREVLTKRPSIYSLAPRLRELSVPTLLIVGEHDEPCVKVHRFMADTIPGARQRADPRRRPPHEPRGAARVQPRGHEVPPRGAAPPRA